MPFGWWVMSGIVSSGRRLNRPQPAWQAGGGSRRGGRRWVAAVLAGGRAGGGRRGGGGVAGCCSPAPGPGPAAAYRTSTAVVPRRTLVSQTAVNATLGYAGSYTVTGRAAGRSPGCRPLGRVIREGGVLYRAGERGAGDLAVRAGSRVAGAAEGMPGGDVPQLNHDLVALGYVNSGYISALGWDYFSWETAYGLEQLQGGGDDRPRGPDRELPLGQAVFVPRALRVTRRDRRRWASPASGRIFTATVGPAGGDDRLDAAQQPEVKPGDKVSVTLPDGTTTPGVISSVGKVASGPGTRPRSPSMSG